MQIDNPDRGFTFKAEGPLDLRMNPEKGISAAERLRDISKEELTGMLIEPEAYAPAMEKFMDFTDEEMTGIHRHFKQVLAENGVAGLSEMFAEDYLSTLIYR